MNSPTLSVIVKKSAYLCQVGLRSTGTIASSFNISAPVNCSTCPDIPIVCLALAVEGLSMAHCRCVREKEAYYSVSRCLLVGGWVAVGFPAVLVLLSHEAEGLGDGCCQHIPQERCLRGRPGIGFFISEVSIVASGLGSCVSDGGDEQYSD